MEKLLCSTHNIEIIIYNKESENLFRDDNRQEVAIFVAEDGKKYLKRFVIGLCDENCFTIKNILKD